MTAKEFASLLNEREIMEEITPAEERQAADAGLVVVFGYSDDNMEFRGAINDEVGCFDGGTAYVTKNGLYDATECGIEDCPHCAAERKAAMPIKAVWHDEGGPCWTYETDIPHETFDIYEDGEVWCVGIVFSMEHLGICSQRREGEFMAGGRPWTPEEETYLMEKWGTLSIPTIANKLNRTVNSIKVRASRLHLGPVLMGGEYVTFNQLMLTLTGGVHSYTYQKESWVKKRGLPIHTKKVVENSFKVVYLDEFWEWAEKNRSFIDFSKMEPLALGAEPDWVAQQRKIDRISYANQRKDPWTPQEDQRLEFLLKQHKYTYAEISRDLRRSNGAIQRRCCDLGLKERPVRESNYNPWSDADLQMMAEMIRQGCSYTMIGDACGGRLEKAVRGIVFSKYHTENADKVRAMLGDGPWGTGAPEPTVKSEKHKAVVKNLTAQLCGLLLARRNSMDFGEYWQKDMC